MNTTELLAAHPDFQDKIAPADRKALGIKTRAERASKIERTSERELQADIRTELKRRDIPFVNPPMFKKSELATGSPDFQFTYGAISVAFECKVGTNQQSQAQHEMEARLIRCGVRYFVITAISQVRSILTSIEIQSE